MLIISEEHARALVTVKAAIAVVEETFIAMARDQARNFVDEAAQALSIGECQHAHGAGLITAQNLRGSLGAVIAGLCEGRLDANEITVFDGTSVALQDLVLAELAVRLATAQGLGLRVAY